MKRIGTVLVFREDVTAEEAAAALTKIADVLELPDTIAHLKKPENRLTYSMFVMADLITEYDDDNGSPVWYIP